MKKQTFYLLLGLFISTFISCTEDINEPNIPDDGVLKFISIRGYPTGIAEIEFQIDLNVIDSNIYEIEWINPKEALGFQPYKELIENDYIVNYNIINKKTSKIHNQTFEIGIDSLISNYDYRDIYIGKYNMTVYYYRWSLDQDLNKKEIYDTINNVGRVEKFKGYTAGDDSNYLNIEFKLGISYDDYSKEWDNSRCGGVNYYTEGFLHPTIDLSGNCTYPELESCEYGLLNGHLRNDSIIINYFWKSKWDGFERQIIGIKID